MYLKFCELKDYLLVVGASAVYIDTIAERKE